MDLLEEIQRNRDTLETKYAQICEHMINFDLLVSYLMGEMVTGEINHEKIRAIPTNHEKAICIWDDLLKRVTNENVGKIMRAFRMSGNNISKQFIQDLGFNEPSHTTDTAAQGATKHFTPPMEGKNPTASLGSSSGSEDEELTTEDRGSGEGKELARYGASGPDKLNRRRGKPAMDQEQLLKGLFGHSSKEVTILRQTEQSKHDDSKIHEYVKKRMEEDKRKEMERRMKDLIRTEIKVGITELEGRIDDKIDKTKKEIDDKIDETKKEIHDKIDETKKEIVNQISKSLFMWAISILLFSLITAILSSVVVLNGKEGTISAESVAEYIKLGKSMVEAAGKFSNLT